MRRERDAFRAHVPYVEIVDPGNARHCCERAPDCLTQGGAQGAAGGKITLAMRIDAQGRVAESCVQRDELGDPVIAACVLELTRGLAFPAPQPAGVVEVAGRRRAGLARVNPLGVMAQRLRNERFRPLESHELLLG